MIIFFVDFWVRATDDGPAFQSGNPRESKISHREIVIYKRMYLIRFLSVRNCRSLLTKNDSVRGSIERVSIELNRKLLSLVTTKKIAAVRVQSKINTLITKNVYDICVKIYRTKNSTISNCCVQLKELRTIY